MNKKVLILGGSGFLGSEVTRKLLEKDYEVCVVCTNIKKAINILGSHSKLNISNVDIFDTAKIQKLILEYNIIINLIGKLFEVEKGDFIRFHNDFPDFLSRNISEKQHFIHVSALGIEKSSNTSLYAKTKLEGEKSIITQSKNYNIVKPSIIFGEKDNFFNLFAKVAKFSPFLPLIGGGHTSFAPVYVKDVADSILFMIENNQKYKNNIFEAAGLNVVDFKDIIDFILNIIAKKRLLINIPFPIAKIQANIMNKFKINLLTPDQVELLKYDNISNNQYDNIDKLIGELQTYKSIVPKYL